MMTYSRNDFEDGRLMLYICNKNLGSVLMHYQEAQSRKSKYSSILIILLLLINFQILMKVGCGECIPYSDSLLGCKDKDSNAHISEVIFNYAYPPYYPVKGRYLPDIKPISYIVKLGANVDDGTKGDLYIYPSKWAPGNPSSEDCLIIVQNTSKDHEMIFEVDLSNFNDKHVLGNLSNKLYLGDNDEPIEFEGPYIWYNVFNMNGDPKINSTNDGRIERITMKIRANETSNFALQLTNKKTKEIFLINQTREYLPDRYSYEFAELSWYPLRENKKIVYFPDAETYRIFLRPM